MDEEDNQQAEEAEQKKFAADRAKVGRAGCKKCKQKIESGSLRVAKVVANPFGSGGGNMKMWHHVNCIFEVRFFNLLWVKKCHLSNTLHSVLT